MCNRTRKHEESPFLATGEISVIDTITITVRRTLIVERQPRLQSIVERIADIPYLRISSLRIEIFPG